MPLPHPTRRLLLCLALALCASSGQAQSPQAPSAEADTPLFAVEIKIGPKWDQSKPPQEQMHFREHSANLKRLRDSGALVMGARYSDKGLVVVAATSEAQVRAMMDEDLSMKAGVFQYEVHSFNVFYGGTVAPRPRRAPAK